MSHYFGNGAAVDDRKSEIPEAYVSWKMMKMELFKYLWNILYEAYIYIYIYTYIHTYAYTYAYTYTYILWKY
jgi:hypothetical protein